jgi:hypothetical protein
VLRDRSFQNRSITKSRPEHNNPPAVLRDAKMGSIHDVIKSAQDIATIDRQPADHFLAKFSESRL